MAIVQGKGKAQQPTEAPIISENAAGRITAPEVISANEISTAEPTTVSTNTKATPPTSSVVSENTTTVRAENANKAQRSSAQTMSATAPQGASRIEAPDLYKKISLEDHGGSGAMTEETSTEKPTLPKVPSPLSAYKPAPPAKNRKEISKRSSIARTDTPIEKEEETHEAAEENPNSPAQPNSHDGTPMNPEKKFVSLMPEMSSRKTSRSSRREKKTQAAAVRKRAEYSGASVYDKLVSEDSSVLKMNEVGIGIEDLVAMCLEPDSVALQRIRDHFGAMLDPTSPTFADDLRNTINKAPFGKKMFVVTFKSPITEPASVQKRVLRVVNGRGIHLHRAMSNLYKADFDGDDMTVTFAEDMMGQAVDSMMYLVSKTGTLSMDLKFFASAPFLGDGTDASRDVLKKIANIVPKGYRKEIADLVRDACVEGSQAYIVLLRRLSQIAENEKMGYMARSNFISNFLTNMDRITHMAAMADYATNVSTHLPELEQLCETREDYALLDAAEWMCETLVEGRFGNNHQEFKARMCAYLGEVDEKNVQFRFSGLGKAIKFNENMHIGPDTGLTKSNKREAQWAELYEKTLLFAAAKVMASRSSRGDRNNVTKETMRRIIIGRIGLPTNKDGAKNYNEFGDFLAAFIREYNDIAVVMREANVISRTDRGIETTDVSFKTIGKGFTGSLAGTNQRIDIETLKDIVPAFVEIYGDFSMKAIFGAYVQFRPDFESQREVGRDRAVIFLIEKYGDMTVHEFVRNNRVLKTETAGKVAKATTLYQTNDKGNIVRNPDGRTKIRSMIELDFIRAIADQKSSQLAEFADVIYRGVKGGRGRGKDDSQCKKMFNVLTQMNKYLMEMEKAKANGYFFDSGEFIQECLEVLTLVGPDMFSYYNMDNAKGFLESKYGQLLLAARSEQEVGGIRMAMVAEMRWARIEQSIERYNSLIKKGASDNAINVAQRHVQAELDALSSSSDMWRMVVADFRSGVWSRIPEMRGEKTILNASDFWEKGEFKKYGMAIDVLLDPTIQAQYKCNIMSDFTKILSGFNNVPSHHIPWMLEADASPVFMDGVTSFSRSIFADNNDFKSRYTRFEKASWRKLKEQVTEARRQINEEELESYIKWLADNPELVCTMDRNTYYDALANTLDVMFDNTEKSKQHPWMNSAYCAASYARNLGFYDSFYMNDDRTLGMIHIDNVNERDIIGILADPNASICVYDDTGDMPELITRASLVGDGSLWDYLEANPRIASALRRTTPVVNIQDTDGRVYVGANANLARSIKEKRTLSNSAIDRTRVFQRLVDKPMYAAMICLATPAHGATSRKSRTRYRKAENAWFSTIMSVAAVKAENPGEPIDIDKVMQDLGITADRVREILDIDENDKFLTATPEQMDRYESGEIDIMDEGDQVYNFTRIAIESYSDMIVSMGLNLTPYAGYELKPIEMDKESIGAFYEARQLFTGAKTMTSTAIEGNQTHKMAVWAAFFHPRDRYVGALVAQGVYDEEELSQCMTELGKSYGELTERELLENPIVELTDAMIASTPIPDETIDSYGNPMTSLGKALLVKRDKGAEDYNLQAKRSGDDGLDSVTKFAARMSQEEADQHFGGIRNYYELYDMLSNVAKSKGLLAAKIELAKRMQKGDELIRFDEDFKFSNYVNIADCMLDQLEDGTLVLRSINQIVQAVKSSIPESILEAENPEEVREFIDGIYSEVGTRFSEADPISFLAGFRARSGKPPIVAGRHPKESSVERNFSALWGIAKSKASEFLEASRISKLDMQTRRADAFLRRLKSGGKYGSLTGYSFLGSLTGKAAQLQSSPGPKNAWIVSDPNVDPDEVSKLIDRAYDCGMTVFFTDCNMVDKKYWKDLETVDADGGETPIFCYPGFYVRLNGSEAQPAPMAYSVFRVSKDRVVRFYEDAIGYWQLGDAEIQLFENLTNRMDYRESGTQTLLVRDIISNTRERYKDNILDISLAEPAVVQRYIVNDPEHTSIDVGITEMAEGFNERWDRTVKAVEDFRSNPGNLDEDMHAITGEPGSIVAWIDVCVRDENNIIGHVLAPIIPFDLTGKNNVPTSFNVKSVSLGNYGLESSGSVEIQWEYNGGLENHYFKGHEGYSASNKGMAAVSKTQTGPTISKTGEKIDYAVDVASTVSRRVGTAARISSMKTLMFEARMAGYNWANVDGAFPNLDDDLATALKGNPTATETIKNMILNGETVPRRVWATLLDSNIRWHENDEMNTFVDMEVRKFFDNGSGDDVAIGGNPSDFLATGPGTADKAVFWEFECMFQQKFLYEDSLIKFIHALNPSLIANGLDAEYGGEQFEVEQMPGEDYGVLCTHITMPDGTRQKVHQYDDWFFAGSEFSGMSKVNTNGASSFMDAICSIALSGRLPRGENLQRMLKWAANDYSRGSGIVVDDEVRGDV